MGEKLSGSATIDQVISPPKADGLGEVSVKPLEWAQLTSRREDGPPDLIAEWEADCLAGIYSITDEGSEWFLSLATITDVFPSIGRSSDPDILRGVAQADYEARILSALVPPSIKREA